MSKPPILAFEVGKVDVLLGELGQQVDPDDEVVSELKDRAVSRLGDLWILEDRHRLLCGDALDGAAVAGLVAGAQADCIFVDAPYNVPITGHETGKGATKHREFAMASGEMSVEGFTTFLRRMAETLAAASREGSVHFVMMDWRRIGEVMAALSPVYTELLTCASGASRTPAFVVMQRLHVDDLVGHLLDIGGWEVLSLPAIAEEAASIPKGPGKMHYRQPGEPLIPGRESKEALEGVKREIGPLDYAAQNQQAPVPPEGNLIKREWLRFYPEPRCAAPGMSSS